LPNNLLSIAQKEMNKLKFIKDEGTAFYKEL